jgi:hypothetical protein
MTILTEPGLDLALKWLGEYLKSELKRPGWETCVESFAETGEGAALYLFPTSWRMREINDYVAFSFYWSNDTVGDPPCVQLYVPALEVFSQRDQLLESLEGPLREAGFGNDYGDGDPDPACPWWRNIPLDIHPKTGVDLSAVLTAIRRGFQDLMKMEQLIGKAVHSQPPAPPPCQRPLTTVAILDTEWTGEAPERKLTELAILNAVYDRQGDEVVGYLGEYIMRRGEKLNKPRALALLEKADRIVAHNASGDRSLVERELPGIPKIKWLDSLYGIDWKGLMGVKSASQQTLMGKAGLRYEQDHHADADARDLKLLLARKHQGGRTYLGRLLESDQKGVR